MHTTHTGACWAPGTPRVTLADPRRAAVEHLRFDAGHPSLTHHQPPSIHPSQTRRAHVAIRHSLWDHPCASEGGSGGHEGKAKAVVPFCAMRGPNMSAALQVARRRGNPDVLIQPALQVRPGWLSVTTSSWASAARAQGYWHRTSAIHNRRQLLRVQPTEYVFETTHRGRRHHLGEGARSVRVPRPSMAAWKVPRLRWRQARFSGRVHRPARSR